MPSPYTEKEPIKGGFAKEKTGKYLPWLTGTLYAVTDEIHQYFVPGRSCEFRDICIDSAGVLCGIFCLCLFKALCQTKLPGNRKA